MGAADWLVTSARLCRLRPLGIFLRVWAYFFQLETELD